MSQSSSVGVPGFRVVVLTTFLCFVGLLSTGCTSGSGKVDPPPAPKVARAESQASSMSGARGAAASSGAGRSDADIDAMWADPTFQKQFVAGYGVNSEIEPRVMADEVALLEKVRPLMAENLPAAEAMLIEQMKPNASAMLDFTLGGIQFQQNKLPEALENYRKAVTKFPGFRRAWRNLGLIHVRMAAYDDSIQAFTKMIELGGGDGYAFGLLGFAYSAKEDYQPAEAAYRSALLLQPDNTEWRLGLTRCVFKQQKYEDAATLLDALLARYPDNAQFWLLQAHTYIGMKQPIKAAENLEVIDRLGKSTPDSLHTLSDLYVNEGLMERACDATTRAINVDTAQPMGRPLRSAEVLAARGALAPAREIVAHVHTVWGGRMEEGDRRKLLKLEARLSLAEGANTAETVAVLEEIVMLDPLDGEALMLLGQHYSRQNQPDRAILYYERAESLEAFEVNAKVRHAQVLVAQSRFLDAIPLLRRAQELKPREDIARYLEQVERAAKAKR